jgi:gas vesicle protein
MSFAILHMQKLKQPAIKGIQIHNQREKESQTNPDIEEDKSHLNYDLVNLEPVDYNKKVNEIIEEKVTTGKAIRKDAVKLASFLVTSDKPFFDGLSEEKEREFFEKAYEFFCDEYGKDNIAYAMVHKDEKTPHMHVGFVPVTEDGRLSAKDFFGKKSQMFELQDKFHQHLKEAGFELERGVSSNRKHIETAKFKAITLETQIKELEQTIQEKEKIVKPLKNIESIPTKEVATNPEILMVSKKQFEALQGLAKYGLKVEEIQDKLNQANQEKEELKTDKRLLEKDLGIERSLNIQLEKENDNLKEENQSLKNTLEKWKDYSKDLLHSIVANLQRINQNKLAEVIQNVSNRLKEKYFAPKEELQEEKKVEKEKVKENEMELDR